LTKESWALDRVGLRGERKYNWLVSFFRNVKLIKKVKLWGFLLQKEEGHAEETSQIRPSPYQPATHWTT